MGFNNFIFEINRDKDREGKEGTKNKSKRARRHKIIIITVLLPEKETAT